MSHHFVPCFQWSASHASLPSSFLVIRISYCVLRMSLEDQGSPLPPGGDIFAISYYQSLSPSEVMDVMNLLLNQQDTPHHLPSTAT